MQNDPVQLFLIMAELSGLLEEHGTSPFQQFLAQKSNSNKVETGISYAKYGTSFF